MTLQGGAFGAQETAARRFSGLLARREWARSRVPSEPLMNPNEIDSRRLRDHCVKAKYTPSHRGSAKVVTWRGILDSSSGDDSGRLSVGERTGGPDCAGAELSYPLIFSRPKCNWRLALRCDDSRVTSPEARVRGSELSRKRSRDAQCGTLGPSVRPF